MEDELIRLHWQPYEPVRRQLVTIVKAVNRRRRYASFPLINPSCLPPLCRLGNVFVDRDAPRVA